MSRMSELSAERQEALNAAQMAYLEAFAAYTKYMDEHHALHRTTEQMRELHRLESLCGLAKMKYEIAQSERYKVIT